MTRPDHQDPGCYIFYSLKIEAFFSCISYHKSVILHCIEDSIETPLKYKHSFESNIEIISTPTRMAT